MLNDYNYAFPINLFSNNLVFHYPSDKISALDIKKKLRFAFKTKFICEFATFFQFYRGWQNEKRKRKKAHTHVNHDITEILFICIPFSIDIIYIIWWFKAKVPLSRSSFGHHV